MNQWDTQPNIRMANGEAIAREFGWVRRVDETSYKVHSQHSDKDYDVIQGEFGWICSCPDYSFRGKKCKHVWAVEISWTLRREVRQTVVIQPVNVSECLFCRSANLKRFGVRKTKAGGIQRFLCTDCGRTFSKNLGFEGMRASPEVISQAMQLYFTGESLRNVQKFMKLQGVEFSHVSVLKWIRKYVGLMEEYLSKIQPQVGNVWRTDELYFKVKGNMKYLFAMMDDETRFWIAQQVADTKGTSDVRPMFKEAERSAGKRPKLLISDGAFNFGVANTKEWFSLHPERCTTHIRDIRLGGQVHNNKMERLNGEVRDREKVMRGLKRDDTPILKGLQIYHNFVRPHEGLKGQTPAERAGIKVEGDNKWLTLIQNASRINADTKGGAHA